MERLYDTFRLEFSDAELAQRLRLAFSWGVPHLPASDLRFYIPARKIDSGDSVFGHLPSAETSNALTLMRTGFRFHDREPHNDQQSDWYPQGLTGTGDAYDDGQMGGKKLLVVSSHGQEIPNVPEGEPKEDARITIADVSDMSSVMYCHIALVKPIIYEGKPTFDPVRSHAGGIVWYRDWLYVSEGSNILVFNLRYVFDFGVDIGVGDSVDYHIDNYVGLDFGGRADSDLSQKKWDRYRLKIGGDARYVLPLLATYSASSDSDYRLRDGHFSTIGLDRTSSPARLIGAKFVAQSECTSDYDTNIEHGITTFWDLDSASGLIANLNASLVLHSREYWVQGVHAAGNTIWYCKSMKRPTTSHDACVVAELVRCDAIGSYRESWDWAAGGEGLTYSSSTDHLWCVTEFRGLRTCFCVRRSRVE